MKSKNIQTLRLYSHYMVKNVFHDAMCVCVCVFVQRRMNECGVQHKRQVVVLALCVCVLWWAKFTHGSNISIASRYTQHTIKYIVHACSTYSLALLPHTLAHSVTLYLCCSSLNVHRHIGHTMLREEDECTRQPKRPSKWKLYAKQFYISDEKFVFYTRMECWLWHNILIEMIHYTDRYGCMFAGCTGMWWKTTMSRISCVTSAKPIDYDAFVEIFHVFGWHFHWICMCIFGLVWHGPSKILDFQACKITITASSFELMSNANEAYLLGVFLTLALNSSHLNREPREKRLFYSPNPPRQQLARSIEAWSVRPSKTYTHTSIESVFFSWPIDSHCGYSIKANNSSFIKCFSPFVPDKI